jgi:hypothetical protein
MRVSLFEVNTDPAGAFHTGAPRLLLSTEKFALQADPPRVCHDGRLGGRNLGRDCRCRSKPINKGAAPPSRSSAGPRTASG